MTLPAFELSAALEAHEPPEARGLARDEVRLLVARRGGAGGAEAIDHATFRDLPAHLRAGDLLVVNTSATLPAAVPGRLPDGTPLELRFSTPAQRRDPESWWVVEPRTPDGARTLALPGPEVPVELPAGRLATLVAPSFGGARLWLAHLGAGEPIIEYLWRHGRPVRYPYARGDWPLDDYQTAFAAEVGSAEMPSAARPLTPELVTRLIAGGILVAPLTLHAGVSSPERGEAPQAERYSVPATTARLVNATRRWGGLVVAVGTTVARALETVSGPAGEVTAGAGWTRLVITPERGLLTIDGLLTGWHEPTASHLQLLEAAAGSRLLERSYEEAIERGYLWHEFGDSHLILPARAPGPQPSRGHLSERPRSGRPSGPRRSRPSLRGVPHEEIVSAAARAFGSS